jgi:hypothetical protein
MDATTNPKTEAEPTPEQVAERANQEYLAIIADERGSNHKIVERAIKVGAQLLFCKSKVAHGNWVPWVKAKCPNISKSTVERWMKLAENKEKIEAEMKERIGKNGTVTFLTLREALAIANGKGGKSDPPTPCDAYDKAEDKLVEKLLALTVAEADAAATKTADALKDTVKTMKAGAKKAAA